MKSIQELREKRGRLVDQAAKLVEDHPDEKWTEEIQAQYDGLKDEVRTIDQEIARIQEVLDLQSSAPGNAAGPVAVAASASAAHIEVKPKPIYRNIGEQLLDVRAMTLDTPEAPAARERFQRVVNAAAGASTGIDSEGGYLVETDKSQDIRETAIEAGILASRCSRQPIGPNSDSYEYLAFDDRDRSQGTALGGLQVYRKHEYETMVSSGKPKLLERELRLEDMYGLVYVTNRMLRDAVALAAAIKRGLRKQLAWKLDREIFEGTGSGECLGIMNSDIVVTVAKKSGQAADTIVAENVVNMLARFKGDINQAGFFVNQDCLPQFPLMTVGDQPIFIPGGSFANAPFGLLFGRPIIPLEFCETVGTKGDIVLADFSEYILIDKGGVEEAESMHVRFLTDEMAYRFIVRNNGQPADEKPITPLKGTNTLSPFVVLEDRA